MSNNWKCEENQDTNPMCFFPYDVVDARWSSCVVDDAPLPTLGSTSTTSINRSIVATSPK